MLLAHLHRIDLGPGLAAGHQQNPPTAGCVGGPLLQRRWL